MGQVLAGRFELLEHIGSGASGTIWRAIDHRLGRECAAKVLRQKDSGELLRFAREQGVRFTHPHLASPYGWAAEDDDVAIAMPLVRGGTLESAMSDHGAFSPALTATLLLQLLDGVQHVHAAGWLHRDVKPANVLLEPTGTGRPHLRLGDFGTALRTDEPRFTQVGYIHGTRGYLAPESMEGAAPSKENDLYAVGIVGLRMLDPSLRSEQAIQDAKQRLSTAPLPVSLRDTLIGLTSDNPQHRLAAAHQAPAKLAGAAQANSYTVASGEPFEVFDHLGNSAPSQPMSTPTPTPTARQTPAPAPTPGPMPMSMATPGVPPQGAAPAKGNSAGRGPILLMGAGVLCIVAAVIVAFL